MNPIKVSIVTVVYNNASTIGDTLDSVAGQDYPNIEHIVIDGNSTDGTSAILEQRKDQLGKYLREADRGIYDAMNKGIGLATGDIVGILNADDFFEESTTISQIVKQFETNPTDCLYGDVQFVSQSDPTRIVRYYSSMHFRPNRFAYGFMPAHPSFYVKRSHYEQLGVYKTDYKIAADYELLIRFLLVHKLKYQYFKHPLVRMRTGGASNAGFLTYWTLNTEVVRACKANGIATSLPQVLCKYFIKLFEFAPGRQKSRIAK